MCITNELSEMAAPLVSLSSTSSSEIDISAIEQSASTCDGRKFIINAHAICDCDWYLTNIRPFVIQHNTVHQRAQQHAEDPEISRNLIVINAHMSLRKCQSIANCHTEFNYNSDMQKCKNSLRVENLGEFYLNCDLELNFVKVGCNASRWL